MGLYIFTFSSSARY